MTLRLMHGLAQFSRNGRPDKGLVPESEHVIQSMHWSHREFSVQITLGNSTRQLTAGQGFGNLGSWTSLIDIINISYQPITNDQEVNIQCF